MAMRSRRLACTLTLALLPAAVATAQRVERTPEKLTPAQVEAQLQYQQGRITLRNGLATIDLPDDLRYLDPRQTNLVLVARGNPPDTTTLGMLVPAESSAVSHNGWVADRRLRRNGPPCR